MEAGLPGGNTAGEMPALFPLESGSASAGIGRGCPSIPVRPPAAGHPAGHRRFIPRELEGSHSFLMGQETCLRHFERNWNAPRTQKLKILSNAVRIATPPGWSRVWLGTWVKSGEIFKVKGMGEAL